MVREPAAALIPPRWQSIQALRGVAVLAVLAVHLLPVERKYSGGDLLLPGWLWLGQTGVDLFFVISGFVMVSVTTGRFGRPGEAARFLWSRAARIYPTYWVYFFLTLAAMFIRPDWVNASQQNQTDLLRSFLLLPHEQLPLVMVAWSLIHELWFYLVFAVLLRGRERWLPGALLFWAVLIVAVNLVTDPLRWGVFAWIMLHPYALEFIAGAGVALLVRATPRPQTSAPVIGTLALLSLAAVPVVVGVGTVLEGSALLRAGALAMLCGTLVWACVTLERLRPQWVPRTLAWVGDASYTIYLSHLLVLGVVGRLWQALDPSPGSLGDNLLAAIAMVAAALVYGRLAWRWIEQPLVRFTQRLLARPPGRSERPMA